MTTSVPSTRSISPTRQDSLVTALRQHEILHKIPPCPDDEIQRLATTILNSPSEGLSAQAFSFSPSGKSLLDRVHYFQNDRGRAVVLKGDPAASGSDKTMYPSILPTSSGVREAAFIQTEPRPIFRTMDPNRTELTILQKLAKTPIEGTVPVLFVRELPKDPEERTQFECIQPLRQGDLFTTFGGDDPRKLIPHEKRKEMQRQIVKAVMGLHADGISHHDLKLENLLLNIEPPTHLRHLPPNSCEVTHDPETKLDVEICDFAFCRNAGDAPSSKASGSPTYLPPEIATYTLNRRRRSETEDGNGPEPICPYSQAGDVWSAGLILLYLEDFDLFSRIVPYKQALRLDDHMGVYLAQYRKYYKQNYIPDFPEPSDKNSRLHAIWRMLQPHPENRPPMKDIYKYFDSQTPLDDGTVACGNDEESILPDLKKFLSSIFERQ